MRLPAVFLVLLAAVLPTRAVGADVTLQFELRWQGQTVEVPTPGMRNTSGQTLRVTRFAALVSGVSLVRVDGSLVRLDGQFGFIDAAQHRLDFTLRGVPEG